MMHMRILSCSMFLRLCSHSKICSSVSPKLLFGILAALARPRFSLRLSLLLYDFMTY